VRKLNELEGVALGMIHKSGPCTPYALRMELRASPSSRWRASAGAIYPLLARLESEGLIRASEDGDDGRGRKLLTITPAGKRALKRWIKEIASPDLISEAIDPLRTRIFFLDALPEDERIRFAENTLIALGDYLTHTQKHLAEKTASDGLFEHLGALGAVMSTENRIDLLKQVLVQMRGGGKSTGRG
jgi:DNA-binding PadR family transcriptional regulator